MKPFTGNKLNIKVFLAPMSSISSFPYRMLNRRFGARFAYLEMINARSLSYENKKTIDLMHTSSKDKPLGIQFLGRGLCFIERALNKLDWDDFSILDFNAACPKDKVTTKGKGAALLEDPDHLKKILKLLVKKSPIPVTLKMRLGWGDSKHSKDIAKIAEDTGVKAVCVHGRTREEGYRGKVDYRPIREIKKALSIPVIGSGDIFNALLAKKMFDETGCDSIMVARGALGNPWIFNEIESFLDKGIIKKRPGIQEVVDTVKYHLRSNCDFFGEEKGIRDFRKFFIWYTRGLSDVKHFRNEVMHITRFNKMIGLIQGLGKYDHVAAST
ncbi:MAG: tRNA dihydrouridine synthase DusB [Candidatus Omnitrophota bacterium]